MRVLLLSVTAGQGHNTCAHAVMAALKARGAQCRLLDTISHVSSVVGTGVDKGYLLLGRVSPSTFGRMYTSALSYSARHKNERASVLAGIPAAGKIARYINIYEPDCIVSTHVFASLILTHLRAKKRLNVPVIGINTDFSLHPYWEEVNQDYMVLACDKMNYAAYARGLAPGTILPFGIPVHTNFSGRMTREEARAALRLPNKLTLTIMSGSMGFGHLTEHIRSLDALPMDFQMAVICGNNQDSYNRIEQDRQNGLFRHGVFVRGFVDNVHEYMSAGDILISKPGGLSTSECLNIGRPLVLIEPIPGLERFNSAFLVNCGAAVYADEYYPLAEAVYNLLTSPDRTHSMAVAQQAINPGNAAERLADFILEQDRGGILPALQGASHELNA